MKNVSDQSLETIFSEKIFHHLQDGIIVMDKNRRIIEMNRAAKELMGLTVEEQVPYCSYCKERELDPGEERCFLIANGGEIPYFSSQMQRVGEYLVDVEMSTALIYVDEDTGERYYVLVLRDLSWKKREEEIQLSKKMVRHLTEVKEEERKRLSQELHDGVSQSLYSIAIAMDNLMESVQDKTEISDYVKEVRRELGQVISDVKYFSEVLRPRVLDQFGVVPAVEILIESIEKNMPHLVIDFQANIVRRYHPVVEINTYRIIQEALHNMMKYAKAERVSIDFNDRGETIEVIIKDNGVGFNPEEAREGLGLLHMQERISHMSGIIDITSECDEGTTVRFQVPAYEEDCD